MSSHALTVTVFAALGVALVCLELAGHVRAWRVPTAGELIRAIVGRPATLVLLVLAWWWVGWHFLAVP